MSYQPAFQDIAHLGHIELYTPHLAESLAFFTNIVGLHESGRQGDSVYSLKLTAAQTSGLGHVAFRTKSAAVLDQLVEHLTQTGSSGVWIDNEYGHGPAFRVAAPDGHPVELYYKTERFVAPSHLTPGFKNQPQCYMPRGMAPRRLDHVNLLAQDVKANRRFFHQQLGLRVTEQIIFDDGTEVGTWLASTNKAYDLAITQDRTPARGRFHHLTYSMDSREDVLRAAEFWLKTGSRLRRDRTNKPSAKPFFSIFMSRVAIVSKWRLVAI